MTLDAGVCTLAGNPATALSVSHANKERRLPAVLAPQADERTEVALRSERALAMRHFTEQQLPNDSVITSVPIIIPIFVKMV